MGDKILVDKKAAENRTKGGIFIPDQAKDKPQEGVVVAVGDGRENMAGNTVPLRTKPGDLILFGKYAGTEIKLNDKSYYIMREEEILGFLHPEEGDVPVSVEETEGEPELVATSGLDAAHF